MKDVSSTQLAVETMVAPVGKSDSTLDLQIDINFHGKGRVKIYKFIDYIERIIISNLGSHTLLLVDKIYFVLLSFTARYILLCLVCKVRFLWDLPCTQPIGVI